MGGRYESVKTLDLGYCVVDIPPELVQPEPSEEPGAGQCQDSGSGFRVSPGHVLYAPERVSMQKQGCLPTSCLR